MFGDNKITKKKELYKTLFDADLHTQVAFPEEEHNPMFCRHLNKQCKRLLTFKAIPVRESKVWRCSCVILDAWFSICSHDTLRFLQNIVLCPLSMKSTAPSLHFQFSGVFWYKAWSPLLSYHLKQCSCGPKMTFSADICCRIATKDFISITLGRNNPFSSSERPTHFH